MSESREAAPQLRCVAPLVAVADGKQRLIGPCVLVTSGAHTIALASAEALRKAGEPLAIATRLDGSATLPVKAWHLGRHPAIGVIDLGDSSRFTPEVEPLALGSLSATVDTRGAPAALIGVRVDAGLFARIAVGVQVVVDDGGGMSDHANRLAVPQERLPDGALLDGAPLFAWMPADPVLGRSSEIVALALGVAPRSQTFGSYAPIAELVGLEDAAIALPWSEQPPPGNDGPVQVAGEIGRFTGPIPKPE